MDWIVLAWDRDQWRALVNTVINRQVAYSVGGNFLIAERLAATQEGLSSVVVVGFGLCSVSYHRLDTSTSRPEFEFVNLVEDRASTGTGCIKLRLFSPTRWVRAYKPYPVQHFV
jgi:hypothetical protein